MAGSSFALIARRAAAVPRRGALGTGLATVLIGLGAVSTPGRVAAAKNRHKRKGKRRKEDCRQWILSGAPDASSSIPRISVDDDLTIFLNGQILFQDEDSGSSSFGPFLFAARRGDRLRFVAVDTAPDCHELSPLYLRCACRGKARKLSDGVPETCPNVAVGEFFDETFTI